MNVCDRVEVIERHQLLLLFICVIKSDVYLEVTHVFLNLRGNATNILTFEISDLLQVNYLKMVNSK